jgi:arsenate reductase
MKNILFVCKENSNRSQMAEAFARIHGKGIVNAFSAGSRPSGKINPAAMDAMNLLSYDLSKHSSKHVDEFREMSFDYVVTMGCGDACPFIPAKHREDWDVPDPKYLEGKYFLLVRNVIEKKVMALLKKMEKES